MLRNPALALIATLFALTALGCEVHHSSCGEEPDAAIEEFEVVIGTGDESCDCDVEFCFKRYSSHDWECALLDDPWADDFESWETGAYYVVPHPEVEVGDLETFEILNTNCGFFNDTLSISWVEIYAHDIYGHTSTVYEDEFHPYEVFDEDEALEPGSCF